jgi:hypothetical protein
MTPPNDGSTTSELIDAAWPPQAAFGCRVYVVSLEARQVQCCGEGDALLEL